MEFLPKKKKKPIWGLSKLHVKDLVVLNLDYLTDFLRKTAKLKHV